MAIAVCRATAVHRVAGGSIAPRLDGVDARHSAGVAAWVTASVVAGHDLNSVVLWMPSRRLWRPFIAPSFYCSCEKKM